MNDNSLMPFGMHRDKKLEDVPARYLLWMYGEGKLYGELKKYVEDNKDVLEKQSKEEKS